MLFSFLAGFTSKPRVKPPPACLECGKCCELYGWHLHASERDRERWRRLGRDDLLARTHPLGWIWLDPQTGRGIDPCPYLDRSDPRHVRCAIHAIKPDMCRDYPTSAHGWRCLRGVWFGP